MTIALNMILVALSAGASPEVQVKNGVLTLRQAGAQVAVRLDAPQLGFEAATLAPVPADSANLSGKHLLSESMVELACPKRTLPNEATVETVLCLQWSEKESILRKWARIRLDKPGYRLDEVILESVKSSGGASEWPPTDIQSQPAFEPGVFYGIEFPVAAVRKEGDRLLLAHRPGAIIEPGVWHETRKAVFGLSAPGQEKEAFRRYIMAHRVPSSDLHIDYNSWWTSPVPYTEKDILDLMQIFETQFYKPYGGRFDSFCIDMGWSNAKALWEIDPKLFPDGFTHIQQAAKKMDSQLGLWISPSAVYPPALDVPWAKSQGYEGQKDGLCLGGARYQAAFGQQLAKMIDQYHVQQFKFDGYRITCPEKDHGHPADQLSAEPIAEGMILAAKTIHEHSKDAWIEPTCFGWNPSPWWLFYFNSVIGSFGDDAPYGRVPAPVYRESYTTARDFFNLQGAYWNPIPPAAQEILGIIHQTDEPFMNDAVMTILRGHRFLPLYVNPKYMNETRWKSLAETLKWARKHVPDFEETHPLLPASWQNGQCPRFTNDAVMPREPYGYAHRMKHGTMVALRNPWIVPQSYNLTLDAASGFADLGKPYNAVSLYPEPRVYAEKVAFGGKLNLLLAPYETLVLSFDEKSAGDLPKADAGTPIEIAPVSPRLETFAFDDSLPALGPDWTCLAGGVASATQLTIDAEVNVMSPQATLLILLDGAPNALSATAKIDGKDVAMRATGSSTGWSATGAPKPEIWTFLDAPLHPGKNHIEATVLFAAEGVKTSAWIWATRPGAKDTPPEELPQPETLSIKALPVLEPIDTPPVSAQKRPRPVERINGAFLDTLAPQSATAGWGTVRMNQSVWEKPITIGGKIYPRGIGTHAPSRIVYPLDKQYKRFQAEAGADGATAPTVTFEVWVDGTKRWESGLMTRDMPARFVNLDVSGAASLELVVGDGGNGLGADHADWAEARLLR